MTHEAQAGAEPFAFDDDELVDAGPRPGLGLVLAAVVAVAASAGLAWWFVGPDPGGDIASAPPPAPPPSAAAPEKPLRFAEAEPDPTAVRRAWVDVQRAYVDGGADALTRASQACARGVPADPALLDYCLAYDVYASAIVTGGEGDWFGDSPTRDLALARTALPEGVDPANRIEQVAALTKAVLPKAAPPKTKAKPKAVRSVRHATPHKAMKVKHRPRPAVKSRPARAAQPAAPPPQSLDDWLNRGQAGELLDPPH